MANSDKSVKWTKLNDTTFCIDASELFSGDQQARAFDSPVTGSRISWETMHPHREEQGGEMSDILYWHTYELKNRLVVYNT